VLQVGHNRRRQPANRRLHRMIADGELGDVQFLETVITNAMNLVPSDGWRSDPVESPAGGMGALGVHMIDTMIYLAGRPTRVSAVSKPVLGHSHLDDVTMIIVEFESGVVGSLVTSMVVAPRTTVAVFGTAAAAWNEDDGASFYVHHVGEPRRTQIDIDTTDTIVDQLAEFGDVIRNGGTPEVGGAEALEVVVVLEGLITSASRRSAVDLAELRDAADER
jgi:predicted dehydrogenase